MNSSSGQWANWYGTPGQSSLPDQEPELIKALFKDALTRAAGGIPVRDHVEQLTRLMQHQSGRREFVQLAQAHALTAVRSAWQRGWEPADVLRYVTRKLSSQQRDLTGDVIVLQLEQYADATIPPCWPSQFREGGLIRWWPKQQSIIEARAHRSGWRDLITDLVAVLDLLARLPQLELLGPLPGEPQQPDTQAAVAAADPRILSRVRGLLAQAESTNFEAEAESFTAAAQALMARHQIDRAMIDAANAATNRGDRLIRAQRLGIDSPYESPKALLLSEVARANRCRMVWTKDLGFGTIVGHAADRAAVEMLFTSLLIQATRAMMAAGSRTRADGSSRTRAFRATFLTSFAARIGERLAEVMEAELTAARTRSDDADLLPVLAARTAAVDAEVTRMFPVTKSSSLGSINDREGWQAGRSAADRAQLGVGRAIDQP